MRPLASPRSPLRRRSRPARLVAVTALAAPPLTPAKPAPIAATPEQRARRAGGPEDRALYTCGCGAAFDAAVQTDVTCPACGAEQSW